MADILNFLDNWFSTNGTITSSNTAKLSKFMSEFGAEIDKLSYIPNNGGRKLANYSPRSLMYFVALSLCSSSIAA